MLNRWIAVAFSAVMLTLAAGGAAEAQSPAPAAAAGAPVPKLEFEKYRLKNGLEVILVEDRRLPLVAVNLWYHVGPANEKPGRTGFAHLFEHMMFQGSKHVPDDGQFKLLEAAGASEINGTTGFDRTNYFETLPSNQLELALWLESDRMGFLLDKLDQAKLTNQRDVVRNERRQSRESPPYGIVDEAVFQALYPKGHPYHASIIGSHADIEAARLGDVREFFRQYYVPNNASIAIVGDIDKARTKALVEKYFGPIPAGAPVPKIDVKTPPITAEKRLVVTDRVQLPKVYMAWLTAPIYQPGDAEADLLAHILGGSKSSRLYEALVYDRKIAQSVSVYQQSLMLGSAFQIEAIAKPGVKPEDLEKAIDDELARMRRDGPTQAELDRARNSIESDIIRGLERLGGFGGVADRLNQYNHYLGDPGYLAQDLARYRNATREALQRLAVSELASDRRVVVYGVPGKKVTQEVPRTKPEDEKETKSVPAPAIAGQDWRRTVPKPGPASPLTLPVPQRFALANGLTVLLVEQHKLPIVSASLVALAGSEANPPNLPGLASFTADMLDEGTATRSALQISAEADRIGAVLGTGSSRDAASASVRTLSPHLETAFDLLADVTLRPAFAVKDLERLRNDRLTALVQQRDDPGTLAGIAFSQALYGPKHPYGYIELGTDASLRAIGRDDLVRFWTEHFTPGNSALVVAGDITAPELRRLAEKHFGAWSGKSAAPQLPALDTAPQRTVTLVDKPGYPQTTLYVGEVGVPRSSPDYVPLQVMNTTLGGLFSSRINMNLREKNGFTYGAGSAFSFRRGPGPFVVSTSVRADATAPAVKEIFGELEKMRASGATPDEVAVARDAFARSLPGMFETTPQTASSVGQLFVYGLPLDYYAGLPRQVNAVTPADVRRVASKYLDPAHMSVVAVGDRSVIEAGLRDLQLGPFVVKDPESLTGGAASAPSPAPTSATSR